MISVTMLSANEIVKNTGNSNYEIKKGGDNVLIISPSTQNSNRSTDDTLQYLPADGSWNGQFVQSPGDAMITAFKMPANATIKAVNVPVYAWGTGDQLLTISLHKLSYPFRTDGTTYPAAAVNGNGWIGGYDMDASGWLSIMGTTYTPGGTAGICDDGDVVVSGSQDPLGTVDASAAPPGTPTMGLLWPVGFSAATMNPTNNPDYYNDGAKDGPTAHWTLLSDFGSEIDVLQGEWIGVMVASQGAGGGEDDATGFFYETGVGVVDPWVSLKFYGECSGTSGNGGWHIRDWMFNFQLAVELTSDRGPVFTSVDPLITTVSTAARAVSADITDDNPIGGEAGVAAVTLTYQLDSLTATVNTVQMTMTSGTDVDGTWEGEIPGQDPGTFVYWKITATDVGANSTVSSPYSYYIFAPTAGAPLLFDNADPLYGNPLYAPYLYYGWGLNPFDYWSGDYGNITASLTANYDVIFERTSGNDTYGFDSDPALDDWYASGGKIYVAEGDEWLSNRYGWPAALELNSSDFAYDLGVGIVHTDINGDADGVSRLFPNADDPLGAVMADYLDSNVVTMIIDSSVTPWDTSYTYAGSILDYDPVYDPGVDNWLDAMTPAEGANVMYYGLTGIIDSLGNPAADADTLAVVVYSYSGFGSKGGVVALNQIGMYARVYNDTGGVTYEHWVGAEDYYADSPGGPVRAIMDWAADNVSINDDKMHAPESFTLKGNYPNPFNPTTNILFTLEKASDVTMTVYSILGQEVAKLQSGNMRSGVHSIKWNGLDMHGKQVASGVYFYQVNVAGQIKTGKMMLLK